MQDAQWLIWKFDTDEDKKLNLEEFAAIFTEKSGKFMKRFKLV